MKRILLIAVLSTVVIGALGMMAVMAKGPPLFASLGPSIAIQPTSPHRRFARSWDVALGHLIAFGIGVTAV